MTERLPKRVDLSEKNGLVPGDQGKLGSSTAFGVHSLILAAARFGPPGTSPGRVFIYWNERDEKKDSESA